MSCNTTTPACPPPVPITIGIPGEKGDTGDPGPRGLTGKSPIEFNLDVDTTGDPIENRVHILSIYEFTASTIVKLAARTAQGTCTVTVRINGVAVSGLNNVAVNSAVTNLYTATAGNAVPVGAKIDIVIAGVTGVFGINLAIDL